jgi:aryl-alcohol dehydrogenase-like predicted oxidoreductase
MKYRNLGATGMKVSELCLGTMGFGTSAWRPWVLDESDSLPIIRAAIEQGINFVDMADFYSDGVSEQVVGKALKHFPRNDLVLATKCYYPMGPGVNNRGLSRKHIFEAVDASLQRAGVDFFDLYIVHGFDPDTPMEETMRALHDVVQSGRVRYLGASTMYAWQFVKMNSIARSAGWTPFISMQCQLNAAYREEEREMIPYCIHEGIAVTPFSPLARGLLSGDASSLRNRTDNFTNDQYGDANSRQIASAVARVAEQRGCTASQVAMAWVNSRPGVTSVLTGVDRVEQLHANLQAMQMQLTPQEIESIDSWYVPADVINDHRPNRMVRGPHPERA